MIIANREFDLNKTHIMGILNVTPDSFSDGGKYNTIDMAIKHTEEMIADGAAIIDVGGESTRPGYTKISDEEEIDRVVPVIEKIKAQFDIPVSIDTYKSVVAKAAIEAGADILNDIWGLKADKNMAKVVKDTNAFCVIMHNRENTDYSNFVEDMLSDLRESVDIALNAGIEKEKIILDPGVGFAKSFENNLSAIKHVERLKELGYPVLLATSNKSVIGLALDLPKEERLEGTMATSAIAVMKGCSFVRVHNVKANRRIIDMMEAVLAAE